MYCKSCGRLIDVKMIKGEPQKCPYPDCNAEIFYEGGNGFWDVATLDDGPARKEPERTVIQPVPGKEREPDRAVLNELSKISSKLDAISKKKSGASPVILIVLAAVCVLLCAFNLLSSSRAMSQMGKDAQKTADSLEALRVAVETTPEPEATPEPVEMPAPTPVIFEPPQNKAADEGSSSVIFTVKLCLAKSESIPSSARWQYCKAEEEYFADLGENAAAWGLFEHSENDDGHWVYTLNAKGLKADATGNYRLVLMFEDGTELVSDIATLTIVAPPTPTPSTDPGNGQGGGE